MIDSIAETGTF